AALTAPALVPLIQPRSTVWSRSSSSSTPHVKAPCAPPPCSARLIRRRLCFPTFRLPRLLPSFVFHRKMAAWRPLRQRQSVEADEPGRDSDAPGGIGGCGQSKDDDDSECCR